MFSLSSFIKVLGMNGVPWVITIATMHMAQWLLWEAVIFLAIKTIPNNTDAEYANIIISSSRNRDAAAAIKAEAEKDPFLRLLGTVGYMSHIAILTIFPLDCSRLSEDSRKNMERENTWAHKFVCMRGHTPRPHAIIAGLLYFNVVGVLLCQLRNLISASRLRWKVQRVLMVGAVWLAFVPILGIIFYFSHLVQFGSGIVSGCLLTWFFLGLQDQNAPATLWSKIFVAHDLAEAIIIFSRCINDVETSYESWVERYFG
jgi:hypothetical protein